MLLADRQQEYTKCAGQIDLDHKYLAERSVLMDIKIIIKTFFDVFNKENK